MTNAEHVITGWPGSSLGVRMAGALSAALMLAACGGGDTYTTTRSVGADCQTQPVAWQDPAGTVTCEASFESAANGSVRTGVDTDLPLVGSARAECVNGTWRVETPSTVCEAAPEGQVQADLSLQASDDTRWFEYFSDAFAEIGQGFDGSEALDGFFNITAFMADGTYQQQGGGFDQFPSEGDWANVFAVTVNLDGTSGLGEETAPIVSMSGSLNPYVPGEGAVIVRPYTTSFSEVVGTVRLEDGEITGIEQLDSVITFTFDTSDLGGFGLGPTTSFSGPFLIEENGDFTLDAGPDYEPTAGAPAYVWDAQGTASVSPRPPAPRATMTLAADDSTRWFEYFSDAFAEIGQGFDGSEALDGFFNITAFMADGSYQQQGGGFDQFPSEGNWADVFTLTVDPAGLTGEGQESAPIIALQGDLNPYIPADQALVQQAYTTSFSAVTGQAVLMDGEITGVDSLASTVSFTFDTSGFGGAFGLGDTTSFSGPFVIDGNGAFTLDAGPEDGEPAAGDPDYVWDAQGQLGALTPVAAAEEGQP